MQCRSDEKIALFSVRFKCRFLTSQDFVTMAPQLPACAQAERVNLQKKKKFSLWCRRITWLDGYSNAYSGA
jgi:hypothetical protein